MKSGKKWTSRAAIVVAVFALGYLARFVYPPVQENTIPSRQFTETLAKEVSISDLPILPVEDGVLDLDLQIPTNANE